jgi:hypothetical protein
MAQVSQLSPELARGLPLLARALVTAVRNWALYPPEHPAVAQSLERLSAAIRQTAGGGAFSVAVTPDTFLVEGAPADRIQSATADGTATGGATIPAPWWKRSSQTRSTLIRRSISEPDELRDWIAG